MHILYPIKLHPQIVDFWIGWDGVEDVHLESPCLFVFLRCMCTLSQNLLYKNRLGHGTGTVQCPPSFFLHNYITYYWPSRGTERPTIN